MSVAEEEGPPPSSGILSAAAYWLPLILISTSLLALVAVPPLLDRQLGDEESYLANTLDPSLLLIEQSRFLQARQFAAVQGFVLSGDPRHRDQYRRFDDRLLDLREELGRILQPAGVDVRARLADLTQPTTLWMFNHLQVLNEEILREDLDPNFVEDDRALYEETLDATQALRQAVNDERQAANATLDQRRALQFPLSAALATLSLLAVISVAFLGRRLNRLLREVETRRGEAVKSRRQSEAVMAASADGIVGIDLGGRATFINRAGRQLLDYSDREVLGRDVHDLLLYLTPEGETFQREVSPILKALRTGEEVTLPESVVWRRDGTALPVQLQLRPLIDGREVKGAVLTFTDVTQERRVSEALRQAVRARDEVLAVVSHDLRNPVGTVFAASDLLLEVELPPERVREHLGIIKRSAARMNRLIQDLLDVARIEAGGLSVVPEPQALSAILEEARQLALPRARDQAVELAIDLPAGLPLVLADRDRILQVLSNLVGNAIKFTPAGGQVLIEAFGEPGWVRTMVSDTGPGIPDEDQDRVFDRFWQVKRSDRGGAGLGLAIVKGIVEAHGGAVEMSNRSGQGSVFSFTLPRPSGTDRPS